MTIKKAEILYHVVQNHPGISKTEAARLMGVKKSALNYIFTICETHGLLLAESDYGELYTLDYVMNQMNRV